MLILANLPELPMVTEALVDSSMLLVILSPTFYFFHYRPLQTHHQERKKIIEQLVKSEERLHLALEAVNDGLVITSYSIHYTKLYESPPSPERATVTCCRVRRLKTYVGI